MQGIVRLMKLQFGLAILACCVLAGCRTAQPSITRDSLVGNYVFKSEDPENRATDHEWDQLTLHANGEYNLVQGGPTKTKSEKTGFWHFSGGDPAVVDLDHAGYPVRVRQGNIRLLIDEDVGIWYEKVR
jgi:hypothetical protein